MRRAALAWLLLPCVAHAAAWDLLWSRNLDGPDHGDDAAEAVACDSAGNIYVAGWFSMTPSGEGANAVVARYTPEGMLAWTRTADRFPPGNSDEYAFGIAAAADGSIWVAGSVSTTGGASDGWLRRFDAAGTTLWEGRYANPSGKQAVFWGVAIDAVTGAVYAAGSEQRDDLFQSGNALLLRYPAGGGVPVTLDASDTAAGWDEWLAVTALPGGGAATAGYVTQAGSTWFLDERLLARRDRELLVPATGITNTDWIVRRFLPGGGVHWTRLYGSEYSADGRMDWARGIAADSAGVLYAGGAVSALGATNSGGFDRFVRAYDPNGLATWTRQIAVVNSKADPVDFAAGVGAGFGLVAVAGSSGRPDIFEGRDLTVDVLDAAGGFSVHDLRYSSGYQLDDLGAAAALDPAGNLIVVGWEDRYDLGQGRNWVVRKYAGPQAAPPPPGTIRAWPSPFDPGRTAGGAFKWAGLAGGAVARVYTQAGRLVREVREAGGSARWDGRNGDGDAVADGVYYWVATAGGRTAGKGTIVVRRAAR